MKSIALRYGLIMLAGFVLYFLFMHLLKLSTNYNFRVLNGIIHLICIFLAIQAYKKTEPKDFNYLSGVAMGIVTSVVGVVPFAIFQLIFLALSPDFMRTLQETVPSIGQYLTPFTAALIVIMEGLAVSAISSYIIMRVVLAMNTDKKSDAHQA